MDPTKNSSKAWKKSFSLYNAPGDALDAMKHLRMGERSFEEHLAKFKLLVSQSGLDKSATVVDLFREMLPYGLQRPICYEFFLSLYSGSKNCPNVCMFFKDVYSMDD